MDTSFSKKPSSSHSLGGGDEPVFLERGLLALQPRHERAGASWPPPSQTVLSLRGKPASGPPHP